MLNSVKRFLNRSRRKRGSAVSQAEKDEAFIRELRSRGVQIGEGCRIYTSDFSTEPFLVTIGNGVGIAGGCKIITHNGAARLLRFQRPDIQSFGRIKIGNDTCILENAILLPGTTIGRDCIIGAGAVVSGTIPDNSLVVGNPARVVGRASLYLRFLARSPNTLDTFHLPDDKRRQFIEEKLKD